MKKRNFQFHRLDQDADWVWSEKEIANQKYRPVSVDEVFSIRDKNTDGYISEEEHKADEAIEFNRIDKNKDGALTATEFTAPVFFKRIDADADDKITDEEYLGFRTKQFRNRDDNADGVIDKEKNKIYPSGKIALPALLAELTLKSPPQTVETEVDLLRPLQTGRV